jgi:hypothetical protein
MGKRAIGKLEAGVAGTLGRREEVDGDKYLGGGRHGLVHVGGEAAAAAAALNGDREMEL